MTRGECSHSLLLLGGVVDRMAVVVVKGRGSGGDDGWVHPPPPPPQVVPRVVNRWPKPDLVSGSDCEDGDGECDDSDDKKLYWRF